MNHRSKRGISKIIKKSLTKIGQIHLVVVTFALKIKHYGKY